MELSNYHIMEEEKLVSPTLIFYEDAIAKNTERLVSIAGSAGRLWHPVYLHRTRGIVKQQMKLGVTRFLCATAAEAVLAAEEGAWEILFTGTLMGPNLERFVELIFDMPQTQFYALIDQKEAAYRLSAAAVRNKLVIPSLMEVKLCSENADIGVEQVIRDYESWDDLPGIRFCGLYQCENHRVSVAENSIRMEQSALETIKKTLEGRARVCGIVLVGGVRAFEYCARNSTFVLAPESAFVGSAHGSVKWVKENLWEAGAVLARVTGHQADCLFTIDVGNKGNASGLLNGRIVETAADAAYQGETYWLWQMKTGHEQKRPAVGTVRYLLPESYQLASSLYPAVLVAKNAAGNWGVTRPLCIVDR